MSLDVTWRVLCLFTDRQTFFTQQIFRQNLTRTKSSAKLERNAKKVVKDQSKVSGDVPESSDGGIVVTFAGRLVQDSAVLVR